MGLTTQGNWMRRGGLWLALPAVASALLLVIPGSGSRPARAADCSGGLAETTICLVNDARTARGLQPFAVSGELSAAARAHSADMVAHRYFAFNSPDGSTPRTRAQRAGYGSGASAFTVIEAIGWGTGDQGTPTGVVQHWLADADARPVILSPSSTDIGVGVASGSPTGSAASATTYTADVGRTGGGPAPEFGKSVTVSPAQGIVLVQLPGGAASARAARFVPLTGARRVPVGSVLDTTRGRVRLISSRGRGKGTQSAVLYSGIFKTTQNRRGHGLTVFRLTGPKPVCGRSARAAVARKRRLWAKGKGKYSTRGTNAAATVRGTFWLTEDSCRGTLIRVRTGVVSVKDLKRGKVYLVNAGHSILIRR
jgi:hypothetical protein